MTITIIMAMFKITNYFKYFTLAFIISLFLPSFVFGKVVAYQCKPYVRSVITIDKDSNFKGLEEHDGIIEDWKTNMYVDYKNRNVDLDVNYSTYSGSYKIIGFYSNIFHAVYYNNKENRVSIISYDIRKKLLYVSVHDIYKNEPDDFFPKFPVQSQTIAFKCY